jgi:PAS domain S-box-containing protein
VLKETIRQSSVLIVEDEAIVAEDLSQKVRALGYQVVGVFPTGEQAISALQEAAPDLVLLDIQLGGSLGSLDGVETAKKLQQGCDAAIVFTTAHSDPETVKRANLIDPFGYILKPFGDRDLAVQLALALHKHRADRALREQIVERRQAEHKLRKSEELLLRAQWGAKAGVWEIDLRTRRMTWSEPYYDLFGVDQSLEPSVQLWLSCIHPEDRHRIEAEYQQSLEDKHDQQMEFRIVKTNDNVRWIHRQGDVEFDDHGEAIRINGISLDITDRKQAEEAVSAVALFPAQNPSPVLRVNAAGILLYMNPASGQVLGELNLRPGQPVPAYLQDLVRESLRTKQAQNVEYEISDHHYLISATPIALKGYANLYWTDITERKRGEVALRRALQFDEAVMSNMAEGLYTVDAEGLLTSMNPVAEHLFGWTLDELRGRKMHDMTHYRRRDGSPFPSEECMGLQVLRQGNTLFNYEDVFIRKDGTFFDVQYSSSPLREGDTITGLIVVFRDITERKRTEEALHVLYELASAVNRADEVAVLYETALDAIMVSLNATRASILLFDEQGVMRFEAWRGLSEAYRIGVEGHSPWTPGHIDPTPILVPDVAASEIGSPLRATILQEGIGALAFIPLTYSGQIIGKFMVYFDRPHVMTDGDLEVTRGIANTLAIGIERKRSERALLEARNRLQKWNVELEQAVNVKTVELVQSQERLRALTTELNLAEQRERKRLASELHDHLQQLLVLGKLKLGRGKQWTDTFPLLGKIIKETDEVLSDALTYTRTLVSELNPPILREHGLAAGLKWLGDHMKRYELDVKVSLEAVDPLELPDAEAVLLFQSVRELLINVSKHSGTHQGWVSSHVSNGELIVEVRDAGVGFNPAAAAAAAVPTGGLSSKFGLFSIQERMRSLGGAFVIESRPEGGTTARLFLPIKETSRNPSEAAPLFTEQDDTSIIRPSSIEPRCTEHPSIKHRIKVLLVDDHAMVRQGLRSILSDYPEIEIVGEANDGIEALCSVEQHRPAVVMMDINMPNMDGIEATARIKARYPDIQIIGLSVNAGSKNQEAMQRCGAAILLSKESVAEGLHDAIIKTANNKVVLGQGL